MKPFLFLIVIAAVTTPARSQSLQVFGYAGVLGEWEITATVTATPDMRAKEFRGPLTLKHIGFCGQDGPEEKKGEIRLRMVDPWFGIFGAPAGMRATVLVDGVSCVYSATMADAYKGTMNCSDKRPVPLTLWVTPQVPQIW